MTENSLKVLITGAAGRIAYSLIPLIGIGQTFGPKQKIDLVLFDLPQTEKILTGIKMEINDCAYCLINSITISTKEEEAFNGVDVIVLLGAAPRREGMERVDLLITNKVIFQKQALLVEKYSKKDVKILVVGNPANTNALIISECAPSIPKENITSLMRLDQNRTVSMVAEKLKLDNQYIRDVVVWGNHSNTQVPCLDYMKITSVNPVDASNTSQESLKKWSDTTLLPIIRKRGLDLINLMGVSSAFSAANAVSNHLRDWFLGVDGNKLNSMGVVSNGCYDIPKGLVYGMPVICKGGFKYEIVKGLTVSSSLQAQMEVSKQELLQEKEMAFS